MVTFSRRTGNESCVDCQILLKLTHVCGKRNLLFDDDRCLPQHELSVQASTEKELRMVSTLDHSSPGATPRPASKGRCDDKPITVFCGLHQ